MDILTGLLNSIFQEFLNFWWLILPVFLFFIFWRLRLIYIRTKYIKDTNWAMVELKVPENILKTPKSMEQIFASLAGIYSFGLTNINIYLEGQVEPWVSFELVGYNGEVHFYIYFPTKYRNLLEAAIYSQYPDAEIHPAADYTELLGANLPNKTYDLWGTDLILAKESYYPIKTYPYFEEMVEERRVDPIAPILEAMSNLKDGEMIWVQVLVSPTGDAGVRPSKWQEEGNEKIGEIAGRTKTKNQKQGAQDVILEWGKNIVKAPVEPPVWGTGEVKPETPTLKFLHPGEQDIVKAIANKISKFGFETDVRWIYLDRRDSFSRDNVSTIMGTFTQELRIENLNSFRPNKKTMTLKTGWLCKLFPWYKKFIELSRKKRLFQSYIHRKFGTHNKVRDEKFPILNAEELATIYHFPSAVVSAPKLRRLEAKKGGPPAELPVE